MRNIGRYRGYGYVVASAVLFGCMPFMAKLIYAEGINTWSLVLMRNAVSLPMSAILAIRQNNTLIVPRKSLGPISLIAVLGCCITPLLLFSSYRFIGTGIATVIDAY